MLRYVDRPTGTFTLVLLAGLTLMPPARPASQAPRIAFAQPVLMSLAPFSDHRLRYVDRDGRRQLDLPEPVIADTLTEPVPAAQHGQPFDVVTEPDKPPASPAERGVRETAAVPVPPASAPAPPPPSRAGEGRRHARTTARAVRFAGRRAIPAPAMATDQLAVVRRYGTSDWAERALAR